MNDNDQYQNQIDNAQIQEMEEDEDGVYQDNEEGGDDDIEERMQMANNQANNF
jgi:hypothetical protein